MNYFDDLKAATLPKAINKLVTDREHPRLTPGEFVALLEAQKKAARPEFMAACHGIERGGKRTPMMEHAVVDSIVATPDGANLSPFECVLRELGINVHGSREHRAAGGTMDLFIDSDVGSALLPTFISKTLLDFAERRYTTNGLIAMRDFTPTGAFLKANIDFTTLDADLKLVGKAAELPEVKIEFGEDSTTTQNKGAAIVVPYKLVRAASIQVLQVALRRVAASQSRAKLVDLISVAYNGADNANVKTKAQWNTTDAGVAGSLDYKTYLTFVGMSDSGQMYTKVIGNLDMILAVLLAPKPSIDPAMLSSILAEKRQVVMGDVLQMRDKAWSNVELIIDSSVPANSLIALDPDFAIGEVIELGSQIQESDRDIRSQQYIATVSEAAKHWVLDSTSIRVMTNI
jgi:hypothetical protein